MYTSESFPVGRVEGRNLLPALYLTVQRTESMQHPTVRSSVAHARQAEGPNVVGPHAIRLI
jgi:hypothetical protein